jgi:signal transduction histidine kinase
MYPLDPKNKNFFFKLYFRILVVILPLIFLLAYMNIVMVHGLTLNMVHFFIPLVASFIITTIISMSVHPLIKKIKRLEHAEYKKQLKVLEQEKKLLKKSKSELMGGMIENIAHQWRQPISSINAILTLITVKKKLGSLSDDVIDDNITRVKSYTAFMTETITDFREFFKEEKCYKEFLVLDCIHMAENLLFAAIEEKNINLEVSCSEKLLCYGLKNELLQTIVVIIKNSIDAYEPSIENGKVSVRVGQNANTISIEVEDEAGGISAHIIDNLFDEGVSSKKDQEGTGIGLSMAKIMIEEHMSGKIEVENRGKGALFTISIPIKL